ncbi:hypothetical protein PAPYR_510 [Paratrimastix pyriformis]|uniref:Uncharacterized protein n=1 Tax=Paratrimastix pyriformis TaxID=342808 RepID=A0ABQ8UTS7_9EUKA|nr:hypothetical protein PAPYR_510 [Paratrimastix pyriformis]
MDTLEIASRKNANETLTNEDLLERLPPELQRAIVERSPSPLRTYIHLLSLSHGIRTSVRGVLRELSFDESDQVLTSITPTITTDTLAALVGPCKSLLKLAFPIPEGARKITVTEAASVGGSWVDEAFGGHTRLAVIEQFPTLSESAVERILSHLPGLAELTASRHLTMSTRLLAALARSCPVLQLLRCSVSETAPPDFAALAPLSGVLKKLVLFGVTSSEESLAALVRSLSAVTSLKLPRSHCPPAALEPIASHLTTLQLGNFDKETDLPGPWLCRLKALSLSLKPGASLVAPLTRLLIANQATLERLNLMATSPDVVRMASLMASLCALPHLTHLKVCGCPLSALPPDLFDRLEDLQIWLVPTGVPHRPGGHPVAIASRRLQRLRVMNGHGFRLALDCPTLMELVLSLCHPTSLHLHCPRLRLLRGRPVPGQHLAEDPEWLLTGSSPQLRVLSSVRLTRSDLLARLCASSSLVRLKALHLDVTWLSNPLDLRLPGQLEQLDLHIERAGRCGEEEGTPLPPFDLQLEAPGLLDLSLAILIPYLPAVRVRLRNCASLVCLGATSPPSVLLAIQVDDEDVALQPRSLNLDGRIQMASLLGLLTRHGARLQNFFSRRLRAVAPEDWPQLTGALSGLPQLARLTMNVSGTPSPLSLACPQLRTLNLEGLPDEVKVVLACPLLLQISGIKPES